MQIVKFDNADNSVIETIFVYVSDHSCCQFHLTNKTTKSFNPIMIKQLLSGVL